MRRATPLRACPALREFFLEHIPTDQKHASRIVSSISGHLGDAQVQADLAEGALASLDARARLMDAIALRMAT